MADRNLLREVADRTEPRAGQRDALQRYDWLRTALSIFVHEGVDEVRITRLADELGVTRGSFYWHFENREDLVDAIVAYWREKNTPAIVRALADAESLQDGIFAFFETCVDEDLFDPRLDLAIREWARRSDDIRAELDAADQARVEAFTEFFKRFDYAMPEAMIRARTIYFSQIGFYALEVDEPLEQRLAYTQDYYRCFTGRTLAPSAAQAFIDRMWDQFGGKT